MAISFTEENYLKVIHRLSEATSEDISTNAVAELMQTKAASVTDMLRKLAEKGWVNYQKYQGVRLSAEGEKIALSIVRKHRLWEVFLVDKMGFNWDEVHEIAEQLEHIESDQLINKLDEYLGFPKTDPHGDPIPNKEGILPELAYSHLSDIKATKTCKLMGVAQDSAVFLQLLTKLNLSLGAKLDIQEINEFDRSIFVSINDATPIFISHEVAKNILVKILA
ncbi:metal-dependent transcriptional regulator [Aquirufa antheringensis]|jgi:DtxR family Mn-dependent transcriptional regulator|uniref:Transcriptional regulator MntR n=1 Tax=Aquirufa antheringensis TaxID=2516559 RepID=A0A4Q9BGS0_9BACT|nr:metal-dependent transcriptional regulator [Aquirufa antheringensis]MCZ2485191.1 metal-dependent transcriptional regulator [Aquirufa antheringensis]MCZ2487373.1 metal-dependent transcriptional regulator [Aquirufa antheringensis]MCZ2490338.1 metal-dependent transcriptional regulator [Aquirufa antheringensis]TBH75492.1 metal-dependent transcriptional regulator [Aquirufa antheringensis]